MSKIGDSLKGIITKHQPTEVKHQTKDALTKEISDSVELTGNQDNAGSSLDAKKALELMKKEGIEPIGRIDLEVPIVSFLLGVIAGLLENKTSEKLPEVGKIAENAQEQSELASYTKELKEQIKRMSHNQKTGSYESIANFQIIKDRFISQHSFGLLTIPPVGRKIVFLGLEPNDAGADKTVSKLKNVFSHLKDKLKPSDENNPYNYHPEVYRSEDLPADPVAFTDVKVSYDDLMGDSYCEGTIIYKDPSLVSKFKFNILDDKFSKTELTISTKKLPKKK